MWESPSSMARVKLVLEYDGTNYVGWQIQENGPSVQGRVQKAVQEVIGALMMIVISSPPFSPVAK